jgi:hypothetical protein
VVNSGKLYGAARRATPARAFLSRDERERRVRDRAQTIYQNDLPDFERGLRDAAPEAAPTLLARLGDIGRLFQNFASGAKIDANGLTESLHEFERTCERLGLSPWRPDTTVGAITRRLRNDVMALADYLHSV